MAFGMHAVATPYFLFFYPGGTPYSDMETRHLAYHLSQGYRMPKPENCEDDM